MDSAINHGKGKSVGRNLSMSINDKQSLHASYMPFVKDGALFVPTNESFSLQDEVVLQLRLVYEGKKLLIPGRVVWIAQGKSQQGTVPGVGIQFVGEQRARIRQFLEDMLGDLLKQPVSNPQY